MQTARWGLGQLAQSKAAESSAASVDPSAAKAATSTATSTDAVVAPESDMTTSDTTTDLEGQTVGVLLNEYA